MSEGIKVAVVGAGRVGSPFAYTLAATELLREIVVIDAEPDRARGGSHGRRGVLRVLPVPVAADEVAALQCSAGVICTAVESEGLDLSQAPKPVRGDDGS